MNKAELEEEINLTVEDLPLEPPEDVKEQIKKADYLRKDLFIYAVGYGEDSITGKKHRMARCTCTHCGKTSFLEYVPADKKSCNLYCASNTIGFIDGFCDKKYSYDSVLCPECGCGVSALHTSKFGGSATTEICGHEILYVCNVRGHLCLLEFYVSKNADRQGQIHYAYMRSEGVVYIGKKHKRVYGCQKWLYGFTYFDKWKYSKRYFDRMRGYHIKAIFGITKSLVESSDTAICALDEYYVQNSHGTNSDIYPVQYMNLWCKYPQIENLVRSGHSLILNSILNICTDSYMRSGQFAFSLKKLVEYINLKAVRPAEMLGLNKQELEKRKNCEADDILKYRLIRDKQNIRLDNDTVKIFPLGAVKDYLDIELPVKLPNIDTAFRYCAKQQNNYFVSAMGTLRDYWLMLVDLYGTFDKNLLFPKNLQAAHDQTAAQVKYKADKIIDENIKRRYSVLKWLAWTDEESGLLIRPCKNQKEIINEGKKLDHCVGRYATDVSKGKTNIFFIRRLDSPGKPFYTLELKNGAIIQDHGYRNALQTKEILNFEAKWLQHIKGVNISGVTSTS